MIHTFSFFVLVSMNCILTCVYDIYFTLWDNVQLIFRG